MPTWSRLGYSVGDELAVVGVATVQQPGADLDVPLPEGDLVARWRPRRPELGRRILRPPGRTGDVGARPGPGPGPGGPRRRASAALAGEVPQGQAVRVGGHQRIEPSAADNRTPVSRGRASSCEAARTTWRSAFGQRRRGQSARGLGRCGPTAGNSTTGKVRRLKRERAAEISIWSSSASKVTAPGSSERTMSVERRGRNDTRAVVDADDFFGRPGWSGRGRCRSPRGCCRGRTTRFRTAPEMTWFVRRRHGPRWPAPRRGSLVRIGTSPERVLSGVSPTTGK